MCPFAVDNNKPGNDNGSYRCQPTGVTDNVKGYEQLIHIPLIMCAQHGQQLDGESQLWAWQWEPLANDKGVYREVESEGSRRQSLGLRYKSKF